MISCQFLIFVSLPRISNESSMTQDNSIVIREYLTTDKEVVMNLIKLNTPNFFAKEEVNDLSNYLDKEIELYYVLLVDGVRRPACAFIKSEAFEERAWNTERKGCL